MKAVVQRVSSAKVCVDGKIVGEIEKGLLVLLGVTHDDTEKESVKMAEKIANLRIFKDEQGKMNRSVLECGYSVLVVSQFTLYANTESGRRPDFIQAAQGAIAEPLFTKCVQNLEKIFGKKVPTGVFGAHMEVESVNEGPVTVIIDVKSYR